MLNFYKTEGEVKIYYIDGKRFGKNFEVVKYLMNRTGWSSSKAHKFIGKFKEAINDEEKK